MSEPPGLLGGLSPWGLLFRVLLVSLAMLGLGELVARTLLTSPSRQDFDAELGWRWRPGAVVANYYEGGAPLRLSSQGANDRELDPKAGRYRLMGLGNSFMEALQVPQAANYTSLVEQHLPNVDFVNLGRSAMLAAHYPVVTRRYLTQVQPDRLVVGLGEGDVLNLLGDEVEVKRDAAGALTAVSIRVSGKDQLKGRFAPIIDRSALATYMMRRVKTGVEGWLKSFRQGDDLAPPIDDRAQAAKAEATQRLTFLLKQLNAQAPVLVLDIPSLHYAPHRRATPSAPHESEVYRTASAAAGVDYVSAGPELIALYEQTGVPGHGFTNLRPGTGHLNEAGHRAVAQAMIRWLNAHVPEVKP